MLVATDSVAQNRSNDAAVSPGETMKALVQPAYGSADVLRFEDVAVPSVGEDDVLLRTRAASVCKGDVHLLTGKPYLIRAVFGLGRPSRRVPGQNVAGVVEKVGKNVRDYQVGDAVYGQVIGAFAERVCAPAAALAPKPARLSFEEAASMPVSGMTALQALRDVGKLSAGQSVLVNGAGGGVGMFAVQIARAMGGRVTAVCSGRHVEAIRALGAEEVIDYTQGDFAAQGRRYDVIVDLVGNRSIAEIKGCLAPTGTFVSCSGSAGGDGLGPIVWMLKVMLAGAFGSQRMALFMQKQGREHLVALNELASRGALKPEVGARFDLAHAADALRLVGSGHAHGTTVITL